MISGYVVTFLLFLPESPRKAPSLSWNSIKEHYKIYHRYFPQLKKYYMESNPSKWYADIILDGMASVFFGCATSCFMLFLYHRDYEFISSIQSQKQKLIATSVLIFFIVDIYIKRRYDRVSQYKIKLDSKYINHMNEVDTLLGTKKKW